MPIPVVSIIIPCYRQAHYLRVAVDSALSQSYPTIEVIVVNDGSDDDTEAVAGTFGERIRYVSKRNGGLASARNAGIAAASGQYLHFLDADDFLHREAIAHLVELMNGREDVVALMGCFEFHGDEATVGVTHPAAAYPFTLLPGLLQGCFAPPHCFLCSKRLVEKVGCFYEQFRACGCEDWDLWLRLALSGADLATTSFTGAYYRRNAGSMSMNTGRMLHSRTEVLLRAHDRIVGQAELLQRWGQELYQAEHRVRRRWLASGRDAAMVEVLTQRLRQLQQHGLSLQGSWRSRLVHTMFGLAGDAYVMTCLRRFAPQRVAFYANGYT